MQLPAPVAAWVLLAHAWALLAPLLLVWSVARNFEFIAERTDYPWMFLVAIALMMAASAFEIAQNTIDKWYLTEDCASGNGTGLCDLLFFWMVVASQGAIIIACVGDQWWITVACSLLTLAYPWFYVRRKLAFIPLAILGFASTGVAFLSFKDPAILLPLLLIGLTQVFYSALLRTGNQTLHGFTTLCASSGVIFLAWGIHSAANDAPNEWLLAGLLAAAMGAVMVLIPRLTSGLSATPRVISES